MDCSTPGFPVLYHLWEFAQAHLHWVGDAIQPSRPLSPPSPPAFKRLSIRVFSNVSALALRGQIIGVSASAPAPVLPLNIQSWFPLGWTGLISLHSKGLSRIYPTPQLKSISSLVFSLYVPTLISIHDYWKNHSFDSTDLCWQSNVSAFQYTV